VEKIRCLAYLFIYLDLVWSYHIMVERLPFMY